LSEQRLPPEVQQALIEYENLRNMLVKIEAELRITESEIAEINEILDNIKELPENVELYKSIGHILLKKDRESVAKELEERKELLLVKQQKYRKQLEILRRQVSDSEKKVRDLLAKYGIRIG